MTSCSNNLILLFGLESLGEDKRGDGKTLLADFVLCNTNLEIETPDFLIYVQPNLKRFLRITKMQLKIFLKRRTLTTSKLKLLAGYALSDFREIFPTQSCNI